MRDLIRRDYHKKESQKWRFLVKQLQPGADSLLPALMECFGPKTHPEFGLTAAEGLLKYGRQSPEYQDLIAFALKNATEKVKAYIQYAVSTCH